MFCIRTWVTVLFLLSLKMGTGPNPTEWSRRGRPLLSLQSSGSKQKDSRSVRYGHNTRSAGPCHDDQRSQYQHQTFDSGLECSKTSKKPSRSNAENNGFNASNLELSMQTELGLANPISPISCRCCRRDGDTATIVLTNSFDLSRT